MSTQPKNRFPESLDPGIAAYVHVLIENGIETIESCQGGEGHCEPEPIVWFIGGMADGLKALAVALEHGLPVFELRRIWVIQAGEIQGPKWALTFCKPDFSYEGLLKRSKHGNGR